MMKYNKDAAAGLPVQSEEQLETLETASDSASTSPSVPVPTCTGNRNKSPLLYLAVATLAMISVAGRSSVLSTGVGQDISTSKFEAHDETTLGTQPTGFDDVEIGIEPEKTGTTTRILEEGSDELPAIAGYKAHGTGGCLFKNELGTIQTPTIEGCAAVCDSKISCVSFEYEKVGTQCQLSSSCDEFSLTVNDEDNRFYWYLKLPGTDPATDSPPDPSNNDAATPEIESESEPESEPTASADTNSVRVSCSSDEDCAAAGEVCVKSDFSLFSKLICCERTNAVAFSNGYEVCSGVAANSFCGREEGLSNSVCSSGVCVSGRCAAGKLEANEVCDEGLDCKLGACAYTRISKVGGRKCCDSGNYVNYGGTDVCTGMPTGASCGYKDVISDSLCASKVCTRGRCVEEQAVDNAICEQDSDCRSGVCARESLAIQADTICCKDGGFVTFSSNNFKVCRGLPTGSSCLDEGETSDSVCESAVCINGRCAEGKVEGNSFCDTNSDCQNGLCAASGWAQELICCPCGTTVLLQSTASGSLREEEVCSPIPDGERCGDDGRKSDQACAGGFCLRGTCGSTRACPGEDCDSDDDCEFFAECIFGVCIIQPLPNPTGWFDPVPTPACNPVVEEEDEEDEELAILAACGPTASPTDGRSDMHDTSPTHGETDLPTSARSSSALPEIDSVDEESNPSPTPTGGTPPGAGIEEDTVQPGTNAVDEDGPNNGGRIVLPFVVFSYRAVASLIMLVLLI